MVTAETTPPDAGRLRVDQLDLRRTNLGLVLRTLRDHGPRSRASLAGELGLTRSTVSSLVGELVERGLVREGQVQRTAVGRPGTELEIDGSQVCGLGAEVNVNRITVVALDLTGQVVSEKRLALDARELSVTQLLVHLVALIVSAVSEQEAVGRRPVGLTIAVAGLVDRDRDLLVHGPNLGWRDVPVGELVRDRLGMDFPVHVDNDGNLAAAAETTPGAPERQDILVLFGEIGIAGGIVADGRLLRGRRGYAGEFGHLTVQPGGRTCGCGRTGCWETVSGLHALLEQVADADDPVRDLQAPLEDRMTEVRRRADAGDARTLAALEQVGTWVGRGAAVLANALNPAAIVLSGYYAAVGEHLLPAVERELRAGVLAVDAGGTRVEVSTLGFGAAVRGAALASLETVWAAPTAVPRRPPPLSEQAVQQQQQSQEKNPQPNATPPQESTT